MADNDDTPKIISLKTGKAVEHVPSEEDVKITHFDTRELQEDLKSPIYSLVALAMDELGNISAKGHTLGGEMDLLVLLDLYHAKVRDNILYGHD